MPTTTDPTTLAIYGPWPCPNCGHPNENVHRCNECGHDMAEDTTTHGIRQ